MLKPKPPTLLTVAPGVYVDPTVRKDIEPGEEYLLLNAEGMNKLGLTAAQLKLIRRLDYCGFIVVHKLTPQRSLLRMSSWNEHLRQVRNEPDFWERPDIKKKWRLSHLAI